MDDEDSMAPGEVEQAYRDARRLLEDEAARRERRARVLRAAQAPLATPARPATRVRHGAPWLMVAGVAGRVALGSGALLRVGDRPAAPAAPAAAAPVAAPATIVAQASPA